MAIVYTKSVLSLECYSQIDGETDVVFKIFWSFTGADGDITNSIPCKTEVPYIAGQPFTPFADLTQDEVLAWVDQYTAPEQIAYWEQAIANNIATQVNTISPPLPWIPPEPTPEPIPPTEGAI
jgi:hypothetical protein